MLMMLDYSIRLILLTYFIYLKEIFCVYILFETVWPLHSLGQGELQFTKKGTGGICHSSKHTLYKRQKTLNFKILNLKRGES